MATQLQYPGALALNGRTRHQGSLGYLPRSNAQRGNATTLLVLLIAFGMARA